MGLGTLGTGFGRLSLLSGGGGGFNLVRDVFGGGAYTGLYYDFTTAAGLYQTNDTSTPVTTDGQAIGRAEDLSPSNNDGTQGTSGARGLWKTTHWLGDGSNDHLVTGLLPGNDMTIIAAIYPTAASDVVAGTIAGVNTRALTIGTDASGYLAVSLGDVSSATTTIKGAADVRNAWSVASAIGAGTTGTLRHNGEQIATGTVGGSINTTIAYLVGAFNNNGTAASNLAGRIARILIVKRSDMSAGLLANAEKAIGAGFVSL